MSTKNEPTQPNLMNQWSLRAGIAIAKSLGLRTVNVVRRDNLVAEMKALGCDVNQDGDSH